MVLKSCNSVISMFEEIFAKLGRVLKGSKEFRGYQNGYSQTTRERQSKRENLTPDKIM